MVVLAPSEVRINEPWPYRPECCATRSIRQNPAVPALGQYTKNVPEPVDAVAGSICVTLLKGFPALVEVRSGRTRGVLLKYDN